MRFATGARVQAHELSLRTGRGWVYRDVDLTAAPGSLTALQAESGGGRTALLLTLGGRMRPSSGSARVDGHELPGAEAKVRGIAALGLSDGVNDLDGRLRVREHLRERLHLRLRPARRSLTRAALRAAGLDDLDTARPVGGLSAEERRRLGVALALVDEPRLLLVDDADRGLPHDRQRELWRTLRELADGGLTVIAACADAGAAHDLADVVALGRPGDDPATRPADGSETGEARP
ncbi:ABC transporter ATP-binding protein [Marinactinospora thermotolerans]|uniref:ABC-type multidrug transport system, ATPase component n=1 Tax=Marinactinospora thermotolerans DSM 45154 TaxID=1122192 RepID=A0A1T4R6B6_9ACTN|nr:ATP-binding cassette domain-containing protein [Marinactinospora thermotolerans]SKA11208.1 ABC-type multidrug transport system, ATPase component [Marinactinospora thermotolerans DSM 45154]